MKVSRKSQSKKGFGLDATSEWAFFQNCDSPGGNIKHVKELAGDFVALAKAAGKEAGCIAFNTSGYLKSSICEPQHWSRWSDDHPEDENSTKACGLFVKRDKIGVGYNKLQQVVDALKKASQITERKNLLSQLRDLLFQDENNGTLIPATGALKMLAQILESNDYEIRRNILGIVRKSVNRTTLRKIVDEVPEFIKFTVQWLKEDHKENEDWAWSILKIVATDPKGQNYMLDTGVVSVLAKHIIPETAYTHIALSCLNTCALNTNNSIAFAQSQELLTGLLKLFQAGGPLVSGVINILWLLSMPKENKKPMEDAGIVEAMEEFVERQSDQKENHKSAKGVLFRLGHLNVTAPPRNESNVMIPHVMLSYNWGCQTLVVRIKDALKDKGYAIWIDIESMAGSTLEAMASAVEQSAVIVIFMTPEYKNSPACRTEAEYAYTLRKPIIPLLVAKNYKPDGWLGALLGSKLYFDVSNFTTTKNISDFETFVHKLTCELGTRGLKSASLPSLPEAPTPSIPAHLDSPPGSSPASARHVSIGRRDFGTKRSSQCGLNPSKSHTYFTNEPFTPKVGTTSLNLSGLIPTGGPAGAFATAHLQMEAPATPSSNGSASDSSSETKTTPTSSIPEQAVNAPEEKVLDTNILTWGESDIEMWLEKNNLSVFKEPFKKEQISNGRALLELKIIAETEVYKNFDYLLTSKFHISTFGVGLTLRFALKELPAFE